MYTDYIIKTSDGDYLRDSQGKVIIYGRLEDAQADLGSFETIEELETVNIKIEKLFEKGLWITYCDEFGKNEYAVNEGKLSKDDYVNVPIFFVNEYF